MQKKYQSKTSRKRRCRVFPIANARGSVEPPCVSMRTDGKHALTRHRTATIGSGQHFCSPTFPDCPVIPTLHHRLFNMNAAPVAVVCLFYPSNGSREDNRREDMATSPDHLSKQNAPCTHWARNVQNLTGR